MPPKNSSKPSKPPKAKFKRRPGLALVVGRAIILPEYYAALKADAAAAANTIGVALTPDEAKAIDNLDWSTVDGHVRALRDLLPGPEAQVAMADAAGW